MPAILPHNNVINCFGAKKVNNSKDDTYAHWDYNQECEQSICN